MGLIGDKLIKLIPPRQREVWIVQYQEIRMNPNNRTDKIGRPVLIVTSIELLNNPNYPLINIIPLSTSGEPDRLCIPIERAYEEIVNGFVPDKNSLAVIPYYQPIELKFFNSDGRCGRIDEVTYGVIVNLLCHEVIGLEDYDFEI